MPTTRTMCRWHHRLASSDSEGRDVLDLSAHTDLSRETSQIQLLTIRKMTRRHHDHCARASVGSTISRFAPLRTLRARPRSACPGLPLVPMTARRARRLMHECAAILRCAGARLGASSRTLLGPAKRGRLQPLGRSGRLLLGSSAGVPFPLCRTGTRWSGRRGACSVDV
jgi:hypothetical protein